MSRGQGTNHQNVRGKEYCMDVQGGNQRCQGSLCSLVLVSSQQIKLQLSSAQADRSFLRQTLPRQGSRLTPKQSSSLFPLGFRLSVLPIASFCSCSVQIRACTHHQSMKGNANGICSRPIDYRKLYNSRLCCLCHPIIQSVIIRCLYIFYIYIYIIFMNPQWAPGCLSFTWRRPCGQFVSTVCLGHMCRS